MGRRRVVRLVATAAAVTVAYGAGVLTGVAGAPGSTPAGDRGGSIDQAADRIAGTSASRVSRQTLERAAIDGMLRALDDRWSRYYQPAAFDRFQAILGGQYSGVGIWVRRDVAGRVVVGSVQPDSPAARAGVAAGQRLVSIAGHTIGAQSVAEVTGLLRGTAGTTVLLAVSSAGGPVRTLALRRELLANTDVTTDAPAPDVVRIRIAAFTRGVGRAVRADLAAARAGHKHGVVLDVRGNPGGLLDEAVETASVFLDGGVVVSYSTPSRPVVVLRALGHGDTTTPLAVLVDGGTASAAEIVAGALQDRNRAVIIGSRTFGKGSVQEPTRLADGSAVEVTVGRYRTPGGRYLDGVGITPDISVPPGAPPALAAQRAVQVLTGLVADAGAGARG